MNKKAGVFEGRGHGLRQAERLEMLMGPCARPLQSRGDCWVKAIRRVVGLVASHRYLSRARNLFQHDQRCTAFGCPVGLEHLGVHDQPVAVLHQQICALRLQTGFYRLTLND